jgi:acetyl-CoA C-acetyltransferase
MKDVVLLGGVRTPVGMHGGALRDMRAQDLAKIVFQEVIKRTGIDPSIIDDVILGNIGSPSEAANIGRVAALMAGLPQSVPGCTVARNCASGLQAITFAYQGIQAEDGEVYLVGGTESMSNIPYVIKNARWGLKLRHSQLTDALWDGLTDPICNQIMGRTAENLAEMYELSRQSLDEYAIQSHKKAFMATRQEKFKDEIVPVEIVKKVAGQEVAREQITQDEGINPTLSMQKAAMYPTVFKENGVVTPANACPISDGAAAMLVMTAEKAQALGLQPMARIVAYDYAGVDPAIMGIGPAKAIPKMFAKMKKRGINISFDDVDVFELNEAFAAQVLACGKDLQANGFNLDWKKVNPNGGAIALGHPVGATGSKITVTLMNELKRRKARYGIVTMCVGGGQGGVMLIENVSA